MKIYSIMPKSALHKEMSLLKKEMRRYYDRERELGGRVAWFEFYDIRTDYKAIVAEIEKRGMTHRERLTIEAFHDFSFKVMKSLEAQDEKACVVV